MTTCSASGGRFGALLMNSVKTARKASEESHLRHSDIWVISMHTEAKEEKRGREGKGRRGERYGHCRPDTYVLRLQQPESLTELQLG